MFSLWVLACSGQSEKSKSEPDPASSHNTTPDQENPSNSTLVTHTKDSLISLGEVHVAIASGSFDKDVRVDIEQLSNFPALAMLVLWPDSHAIRMVITDPHTDEILSLKDLQKSMMLSFSVTAENLEELGHLKLTLIENANHTTYERKVLIPHNQLVITPHPQQGGRFIVKYANPLVSDPNHPLDVLIALVDSRKGTQGFAERPSYNHDDDNQDDEGDDEGDGEGDDDEPELSIVATPEFSVAAGTYTSAQSVTLSTTTPEASLYYTVDGSDPTTASTLYSTSITVSESLTLKVIAVRDGWQNSAVASATYVINIEEVADAETILAYWSFDNAPGNVVSDLQNNFNLSWPSDDIWSYGKINSAGMRQNDITTTVTWPNGSNGVGVFGWVIVDGHYSGYGTIFEISNTLRIQIRTDGGGWEMTGYRVQSYQNGSWHTGYEHTFNVMIQYLFFYAFVDAEGHIHSAFHADTSGSASIATANIGLSATTYGNKTVRFADDHYQVLPTYDEMGLITQPLTYAQFIGLYNNGSGRNFPGAVGVVTGE